MVHQVYAQIFEGGVKNIMVCENYELANWLTRATYGEEAYAVDCSQYPCETGDKYRDGRFYRTGENGAEIEIEYVPTQEQQVQQLQGENTELQLALADAYEQNLALELSVTDTQLAIAQIYEGMEV